jgi:hypothetical protein
MICEVPVGVVHSVSGNFLGMDKTGYLDAFKERVGRLMDVCITWIHFACAEKTLTNLECETVGLDRLDTTKSDYLEEVTRCVYCIHILFYFHRIFVRNFRDVRFVGCLHVDSCIRLLFKTLLRVNVYYGDF